MVRPSARTPALDDAHGAERINMSWLARLRWATIAGQALLIAVVQWRMGLPVPLGALGWILAFEIAFNAGIEGWLRGPAPVTEVMVAAALAVDVACFTGLLYFTGGPMNPFSFLYLVHIALAGLVLPPRWTWPLVLLSASASAALFAFHVPLPMDPSMHMEHMEHMEHMTHGGESMGMHLRGMWVAFATAAAFIVYFMHRVTGALAERERELSRAREQAARSEKLASMATLAAGAAHELATPLATIAVAARELGRHGQPDAIAADARLIREQVERCRNILNQMAGDAGTSPGEAPTSIAARELVRATLDGLPGAERVRILWGDGAEGSLVVPMQATTRALRNVLKNGLDASPAGAGVTLQVEQSRAGDFRFEVADTGKGMPPDVLARAAEPFFTTKEPGSGMGLGLFLTRSVLDQVGGTLHIESELGVGTRVVCTIPCGDPRGPGEGAAMGRIAAPVAP